MLERAFPNLALDFKIFWGGACPQTPLAVRAFGARFCTPPNFFPLLWPCKQWKNARKNAYQCLEELINGRKMLINVRKTLINSIETGKKR